MSLYDMLEQQGNMALSGLENSERAQIANEIHNRNIRNENLGALMGAGLEGIDAYQTYKDRPKTATQLTASKDAAPAGSDAFNWDIPNPFAHHGALSQQAIYNSLTSHGYEQPE